MKEWVDTLCASPVDLDRWALIGISAPAWCCMKQKLKAVPHDLTRGRIGVRRLH